MHIIGTNHVIVIPIYLQAILTLALLIGMGMLVLSFYFKNRAECDLLFSRLAAGIKKIAGANWRTTLTGAGTAIMAGLTMVAALPNSLGDMAEIIPPAYKPDVIKVSLGAAVLLHIGNSLFQKDKSVTGGSIAQDVLGNVSALQPLLAPAPIQAPIQAIPQVHPPE
jgi:hypothetical protein